MGVRETLERMFRPARKHHLQYASPAQWARSLPVPLLEITDTAEQDRRFEELEELKQHLWKEHVGTLTAEERASFDDGSHVSLSHRFSERAQPIADEFVEALRQRGIRSAVRVGAYHGDRLVLSAELEARPANDEDDLPWLFRGFEVKYSWPGAGNQ